ncbi:hypothetical protein O181_014703 [Austropuccinia psidii MF-1]|uniref:Retrotransposon gag domain-containing protein n=1 Tax=Austropuccinia psidii MF-1 TaxID=1389203 RepID=A0A9Q3C1R4_9BASI|nr:hypothetical protein [Austropuccinia psidii MF-1]
MAPQQKEGRVPRRSISLSGVACGFPGLSRTGLKVHSEDDDEEEENSVEEEESDGTEGAPAPVGASQSIVGPTLAQSDQPVSHRSEPSLLAIMQQMTQIMANLQEASSSVSSRPSAFKTPFMKAPECFDGTQPFNVRSFIQSFQLIFHNNPANFSQDISLYISDFRSLVSRGGAWGERALIHHFRKGLPSRILDQLASHPSRIDSLQDLRDVTLELDTRYHERQKEENHY